MPAQILVQGKLLGAESFLTEPSVRDGSVAAKALWLALVCEAIPRALLAEFELARVLLGSSGGGQFLLVLPGEIRDAAEGFLAAAAGRIGATTGARVRLIWGVTENLGDWTVVRRRLQEDLHHKENRPLAASRSFEPFEPADSNDDLFTAGLARDLRQAPAISWAPERPLLLSTEPSPRSWAVSPNVSLEGITMARHAAPGNDEGEPATTRQLAERARGRHAWGVLCGEVDLWNLRLRRLTSIEEYVQLSMLYKQFFAGELGVLSLQGDFWQRITIVSSGTHDFAICGAWDALILLANELQRTFHRFAEENLTEFPGAAAKTITMAIALASSPEDTLEQSFEQATRDLKLAQASDKDCIHLFGRIVEWKQLADAAELKEAVSRVSEDFRTAGRQFLTELTRIYAKASSATDSQTDHEKLLRRAYRFQRRYRAATNTRREREFGKLRTHLIGEIVGRNLRSTQGKPLRLRPAGVVALEWARLAEEV